ncbi:hypothetical protein JW921_11375 [Candidatus Fermentibacterales bacterium]|nr:hypothetical protein [Candidatus Fermentibacterales bacterium]
MSRVAQVLLALVGFSAGAAIAGSRKRGVVPSLADVPLAVALSVAAAVARSWLAHVPAMLIALAGGAVLSILVNPLRKPPPVPAHPVPGGAKGSGLLARAWSAWKRTASTMGAFQGRLVLSLFYFIILAPFGVIYRITSDPLARRSSKRPSWLDRHEGPRDVKNARNQF